LRASKPISPAYPLELNTLGDHLRKHRLDLGLLQKDVARIIGCDPCSIYDWENHRCRPQLRFIPTIIDFLGYLPTDDSTETFGEGIVRARRMRGMTQWELAHKLGVDPTTLSRWERGIGLPTRENWERLEGFLNTVQDEENVQRICSR
jgi:DNA-binding XRE family transcriptional regulator